jgi:hypothetical protein
MAAGNEDLASLGKKELLSMLRFGADRIFAAAEGRPPTDAELDAIIDRTEKQAAVKAGRFSLDLVRVASDTIPSYGHMYSRQHDTELCAVVGRLNRLKQAASANCISTTCIRICVQTSSASDCRASLRQ